MPLPQSPLSTLFVREARAAFTARISSLAPASRDALNACATRDLLDRISNGSIVLPADDAALLRHPIISLPSLYTSQVSRLLEELETNGPIATGTSVGVIGYSSGILPALLVATSLPSPRTADVRASASSQIVILRNALALLEVAFSIGIEAQMAKESILTEAGVSLDDPTRESEWSAVVVGQTRDALEAALASWNSQKEVRIIRIIVLNCYAVHHWFPVLILKRLPSM